jgi:hypothetical protein
MLPQRRGITNLNLFLNYIDHFDFIKVVYTFSFIGSTLVLQSTLSSDSSIISGIEDFDSAWPGSKWKCIKVVINATLSITVPN